jgi:hypothetical protein
MTTLGMPTSMFLVFAATIAAGSLGAIHYVIYHIILDRPFGDEDDEIEKRDPGDRTAASEDQAHGTSASDSSDGGSGSGLGTHR